MKSKAVHMSKQYSGHVLPLYCINSCLFLNSVPAVCSAPAKLCPVVLGYSQLSGYFSTIPWMICLQ